MQMSIEKIKKLLNANVFFYEDYANESLFKIILDDIADNEIGEYNTVEEWKNIIQSKLPNILGTDTVAKTVYDCCLITEKKKIIVDGSRKYRLKLVKVIYTYDEYLKAHELDQLF